MKSLKIVGTVFGSLIGIALLYLVRIILIPFKKIESVPVIVTNELELKQEICDYRQNVSFVVDGDKIDAWLYMPEGMTEPVPCVILSNGFGGTKGLVLEEYAKRYREQGIAALAYDFRTFGSSEGEPRQLFDIKMQHEDLAAAIMFAKNLEGIDSSKIILWGTSASGGYGLVQAAKDKEIAGVICQCPALDTHADGEMALERQGILFFLRLFIHAQRDKGRSRFGLSPHYVPITGEEESFAFINTKEAYEGYSSLISPTFVNKVCARSLFSASNTNPKDFAKEVTCPVLLQICEFDNLVSEKSYKETAEILGDYGKVIAYPCSHFEIYSGKHFENGVKDQIEFLLKINKV